MYLLFGLFLKNSDNVNVLIDFGNEVNAMTSAYASKLGF